MIKLTCVRGSVWRSVRDSVRGSVWSSVGDSVKFAIEKSSEK